MVHHRPTRIDSGPSLPPSAKVIAGGINWVGHEAVIERAQSQAHDLAEQRAQEEGPGKTIIIRIQIFATYAPDSSVFQPYDTRVEFFGVGRDEAEAIRDGNARTYRYGKPFGVSVVGSEQLEFSSSDLLSHPSDRITAPTDMPIARPSAPEHNGAPTSAPGHDRVREGIDLNRQYERAEKIERTADMCSSKPSQCYIIAEKSSRIYGVLPFGSQAKPHSRRIVGYIVRSN